MILSQKKIGAENLYTAVEELNRTLHIPSCLKEVIADEAVFTENWMRWPHLQKQADVQKQIR